jgi:hypothetical protein
MTKKKSKAFKKKEEELTRLVKKSGRTPEYKKKRSGKPA